MERAWRKETRCSVWSKSPVTVCLLSRKQGQFRLFLNGEKIKENSLIFIRGKKILQCPHVVCNADDSYTGSDSFKHLESNGAFYIMNECFYFKTSPDSVFPSDRKCLFGVMYSAPLHAAFTRS